MSESVGVIYRIRNKVNGHSYIGQTCDFARRIYEHRKHSKRVKNSLYNAVRAYGWENFECEILETEFETMDELDAAEILWIMGQGYYNIALGGGGSPMRGRHHTDETKEKIAAIFRGKKAGPRSQETKDKIGRGNKGKVRSQEFCQAMSEVRKGRKLTAENKAIALKNLRPPTPEILARIAKTYEGKRKDLKGYSFNSRSKKFIVTVACSGVDYYFGYFLEEERAKLCVLAFKVAHPEYFGPVEGDIPEDYIEQYTKEQIGGRSGKGYKFVNRLNKWEINLVRGREVLLRKKVKTEAEAIEAVEKALYKSNLHTHQRLWLTPGAIIIE